MSKELIVSVNGREKKIAIVEDDLVTEFYVERGDENQGIVGNIYKGRVMKVLPGMQSAFVDIGLERDSFLYVSDFFDEEEFEEGIVEEKKESSRPAAKPERTRQAREAVRIESVGAPEMEEDKELDLHVAALKHIEELATEPAIEPPDEDITELAAVESEIGAKGRVSEVNPRQRRQRRLRYAEAETTEEETPAEKERSGEAAEEIPAIEAEAEDEVTGRRRRRRRRRGSDVAEAETSSADSDEQVDEGMAEREEVFEATPFIIVHHEPLERITDEDIEQTHGEMLKDAMLQERISGRIHEEERRTSLIEVEPTPEVHVGSFQHKIETDLERISDDPTESNERTVRTEIIHDWPGARMKSALDEIPAELITEEEETESGKSPNQHLFDVGENVELLHLDPLQSDLEGEESDSTVEPEQDEELKDASAEMRQRPRRGEFATRRGGRGRRRGFRPRTSVAETAVEVEETNGGPDEEQEPAIPAISRSVERFHRPVISDLLREGQEIIVQIAKEPIGQKGARITSHIALPGRYIVYMPTVEHIGVSRKIGTDEERQRLKRTLHQLRAEAGVGGGFIVRTAANGCTLDELREDMQYLIRTWTDIRRRAERAKAPAIAHRDLDLVQRILRDQLSTDFTAIRVDNEFEYERIVDFVNRFAPKLVNRVKLYTKDTPILEHYGIQAEIDKAVKPRVWLKSGGYIVINQTEALVAIDVNTGKFVGKSNRLEDTIVKTNMEAAKEIVRQIRLRDLGGIIVLDFIDMEERRNRQKVMQALEQEIRSDRSPSKILQFNDFGLVAITRKRVKQSLERTLCTPCYYCGGGGMIKSSQTICYEILAEARRVSKEVDSHNEVILRVNPEVAKALRGTERDILIEIEAYLGGVLTIKSDPSIHQEQFDIALA
jgi:ribonuclease G